MKIFSALLLVAVLGGCASFLTSNQQTSIALLVDAAVGVSVQNGSKDPDVWAERASRIVSITKQLQALDNGTVATLPALTKALAPMIAAATLSPAEVLAADALIMALSQVIAQNSGNVNLPTQTAIQLVLSDILAAASVYIPAHP